MVARGHQIAAYPRPAEPIRLLLIDDEADTLSPVLAQGLEPLGFSLIKESEPANALQNGGGVCTGRDPSGPALSGRTMNSASPVPPAAGC